MEQILTGFYSTHIVNFISWNKAYAIFPVPTYFEQKGYLLRPLDEHLGQHLAKYSKRSYKFQDVVWEGEDPVPALQGLRRISDRHSWIIPFDTAGVEDSRTPDSVLEYAGFTIEKSVAAEKDRREAASHLERYEINTERIKAEVLRFEYLSGSPDWSRFLWDRLLRLTEFELFKMEPYSLPPHFRDLLRDPSSADWETIFKSERWRYYDKEIPTWYAQWERLESWKAKGKYDAVLV